MRVIQGDTRHLDCGEFAFVGSRLFGFRVWRLGHKVPKP